MAGEQHVRHPPPVPLVGAGILRVFEQPVPVRLLREALLVRKDARHHAAHGVRERHRGDLPAGDDEIAHADLLVHAFVDKALVDALVVAADENEVVKALLQFPRDGLRERAPAGGKIDGVPPRTGLLAHARPAAVKGIGLHHRAASAAVGIVVHLHLFVGGEVPDLVRFDGDVPALLRAAEDARVHHRVHRVGKESENVNPHWFPAPRSS